MSDDKDVPPGIEVTGGPLHPEDQANVALFNVCSILARNTMRLSHALRNDPGVSEDTQRVADELFNSVGPMLDNLEKFAEIWQIEES